MTDKTKAHLEKAKSIEDKLRTLYDLQLIDSRIDAIRNVRGELPLEIQDLEDEIEGLKVRHERLQEELKEIDQSILSKKNSIKESEMFIKKYTEQQKGVRNNREFISISKEIDYQKLEIQLSEKHIKEFSVKQELKKETIEKTSESIDLCERSLSEKKGELDAILSETEKEEKLLLGRVSEFRIGIEESLLVVYDKLRKNLKNGLAIVPLERGASTGSFFILPPQLQQEVQNRKRIITDEHSGRILVDAILAQEEQEKIDALLAR